MYVTQNDLDRIVNRTWSDLEQFKRWEETHRRMREAALRGGRPQTIQAIVLRPGVVVYPHPDITDDDQTW